jgi:hypothetical protein
MSIQQSEARKRVIPFGRDQASAATVDESGRSIIALLGRAADAAKEECAKVVALTHKLAFQVRAVEERARNAEERAQALEAEIAHFRDRALRAEDWLRHIHTEVEQAFFGKKGNGATQLPQEKTNGTKQGGRN